LIGALGQHNQPGEHLVLTQPFHVRQGGGPGGKTRHDLRHQRDRGKARGLSFPRSDALDLGDAIPDINKFGQAINEQLTAVRRDALSVVQSEVKPANLLLAGTHKYKTP
jgi:hypothetical protein